MERVENRLVGKVVSALDIDSGEVTPALFREQLLGAGAILLRNAVPMTLMDPWARAAISIIEHFNAIPAEVIEREMEVEQAAFRARWEQKLTQGLHYNDDFVTLTRGEFTVFDGIRRTGLKSLAKEAFPESEVREFHISALRRVFPAAREGYAAGALAPHLDAEFQRFDVLGLNFWTPLTPANGDAPGVAVLPMSVEDSKALAAFNPEGYPDHPPGKGGQNKHRFRSENITNEALKGVGLYERFWAPEMVPGDVLVFTNFTIHASWRNPAMTKPRTSIEARVLLEPRAA